MPLTDLVLLIVIAFLALMQLASFVIMFFLVRRMLDEKPVTIEQPAAPGVAPIVTTRADLKAAREFQAEQNFKDKAESNMVDLNDMPVDVAMAELEKYNNGVS